MLPPATCFILLKDAVGVFEIKGRIQLSWRNGEGKGDNERSLQKGHANKCRARERKNQLVSWDYTFVERKTGGTEHTGTDRRGSFHKVPKGNMKKAQIVVGGKENQ